MSVEMNFMTFWHDVVEADVVVSESRQVDFPVPQVITVVSVYFRIKKSYFKFRKFIFLDKRLNVKI